MPTRLTPQGLEVETYEETRADIVARIRANVSKTANLEEDSLTGNLVSIVSTKLRELGEALEALYDAMNPDAATGASLEHVAAITGTTREDATFSTVAAKVTVMPGTYAAGSLVAHVEGDPEARFENATEVVNSGGSAVEIEVLFIAQNPGPVAAPAGTLTVIAGAVAGWTAVTNAEDAELGQEVEIDSALRLRREQELSAQGSTNTDAIRAHLLRAIPEITSCIVIENETDVTDGNGVPPHSIEAIVVAPGVADADIAQEIWDAKGGGIRTHGTTTTVIADSQGVEHAVKFTRQTDVDIHLRLAIEAIEESYVGDAEFKSQLVEAANAYYGLGRDVKRSKIVALAHGIGGVFDVPLEDLELSEDGVLWAAADIEVLFRERARFSTSRVTITSTTFVQE